MLKSDQFDRYDPPRTPHAPWPPLDEITSALENLTTALDVEDDFQALLYEVCQQVTRALAGADEASITVLNDTEKRTVATTSEQIVRLDQDQYDTGKGPCLEAAHTGRVVRAAMAEAEGRWPEFVADARHAGFGSFLSAPLVVSDAFAGTLNCYSQNSNGFADIEEQLLELYTTAVEAALHTHRRYAEARTTTEQLRRALTSRAVIDQAKGILMAVHKINADEAFNLLSRRSQRENLKLHTIAERLVARATNAPCP